MNYKTNLVLLIIILILQNTAYSDLTDTLKDLRLKANDTDEVKRLIESGADVNKKDSEGETPLMIAINYGRTEAALILIEHNADVNIVSSNRWQETALDIAIRRANSEIISLLLSKELKKENIENTLIRFVKYDENIALTLINYYENKYKDKIFFSKLLYEAIFHSKATIAIILVQKGADVNWKSSNLSKYWKSALTAALYTGNVEFLKHLLDNGIIDRQTLCTLFIDNAIERYGTDYEMTKFIYDNGFDINYIDGNGNSALHKSAAMLYNPDKKFDLVNLIIAKNPDLNIQNALGETALIKSAQSKFKYLFLKLLEKNADISIKDKTGNDALFYACINLDIECIEAILKIEEKITKINTDSLYLLTVQNPDFSVFEKLSEKIHNVNIPDRSGRTAIINSVLKENYMALARLILRKADLDTKDETGRTALMYASEKEEFYEYDPAKLDSASQEVKDFLTIYKKPSKFPGYNHIMFYPVEILLDKGAKVNLTDNNGNNALYYAVTSKTAQNIETLKKYGSENVSNSVKFLSFIKPECISTAPFIGIYFSTAYHISFESVYFISYSPETPYPTSNIMAGSEIGLAGSKLFLGFHKSKIITEYTGRTFSARGFVSYNWMDTSVYSLPFEIEKKLYYGGEVQFSMIISYLAISTKLGLFVPFENSDDARFCISLGWGI